MNAAEFQQRTKQLAVRVNKMVEALPRNRSADVIGRQLLRSATSVAANYRSACTAQSRADMIRKLKIVEEEADESLLWMELLVESGLMNEAKLADLIQEMREILKMVIASIKTLRKQKATEDQKRLRQKPNNGQ